MKATKTKWVTGPPASAQWEMDRVEEKADAGKERMRRDLVATLPLGWREAVVETLREDAELPFLILALSGARPGELAAGVRLHRLPGRAGRLGAPRIRFEIRCAKLPASYGYVERKITIYAAASPLARKLDEILLASPWLCAGFRWECPPEVLVAIAKSVNEYGSKLKLVDDRTLTPYALRHQFAQELRAQGATAEKIAAAMGHIYLAQQRGYLPTKKVARRATNLSCDVVVESACMSAPLVSESRRGSPNKWRSAASGLTYPIQELMPSIRTAVDRDYEAAEMHIRSPRARGEFDLDEPEQSL